VRVSNLSIRAEQRDTPSPPQNSVGALAAQTPAPKRSKGKEHIHAHIKAHKRGDTPAWRTGGRGPNVRISSHLPPGRGTRVRKNQPDPPRGVKRPMQLVRTAHDPLSQQNLLHQHGTWRQQGNPFLAVKAGPVPRLPGSPPRLRKAVAVRRGAASSWRCTRRWRCHRDCGPAVAGRPASALAGFSVHLIY